MAISYRLMGTVTRPHGLRGEFKVRPETDDPERFDSLPAVYIGKDEESAERFAIEAVRYQPMGSGMAVVLTLEGIHDRDQAERLSGRSVFADEADLPPLGDDEFFLSDLIGLKAVDPEGVVLGIVLDVLELPAQPVLVIERPGGAQVMIPFVDDFVEAVDPQQDLLVLRPADGLLDPDSQEVVDE